MGKYIRKPKTTRDVAVKDVSQTYLGVRTRARTLALQRLQSSSTADADAADDSPPEPKPDFLELRSRRLVKPPLIRKNFQSSRKTPAPKQGFVSRDDESPQFESSTEKSSSEPEAFPIEPAEEEGGRFESLDGGLEIGDSEIEASLGENNLDLEARERGTRESTPSSFIRPADSVTTPGSSTRPRSPNPRAQDVRRDIPTSHEMDDFFAQAELPQQRRFIEKYNFDIVNDMPLPGRYEWVKVTP
ncbi:cyclin-dependent kinase inhibitor 3 [Phtheirospermum japonicum]|uniref:Cyclin-dependent kinase inhibitor 3 n=1 Tax=Phtheirospermum japonicum TaxID=374723 RepID=A0A830C876_9LAMI|nr:cyclin-dependent kinase inhibitor 3 [Phtheirospermum japonicum]